MFSVSASASTSVERTEAVEYRWIPLFHFNHNQVDFTVVYTSLSDLHYEIDSGFFPKRDPESDNAVPTTTHELCQYLIRLREDLHKNATAMYALDEMKKPGYKKHGSTQLSSEMNPVSFWEDKGPDSRPSLTFSDVYHAAFGLKRNDAVLRHLTPYRTKLLLAIGDAKSSNYKALQMFIENPGKAGSEFRGLETSIREIWNEYHYFLVDAMIAQHANRRIPYNDHVRGEGPNGLRKTLEDHDKFVQAEKSLAVHIGKSMDYTVKIMKEAALKGEEDSLAHDIRNWYGWVNEAMWRQFDYIKTTRGRALNEHKALVEQSLSRHEESKSRVRRAFSRVFSRSSSEKKNKGKK